MRVAHVTLHGCIRAHKMAWALCEKGVETHFLASNISPTHSATPYATVMLWEAFNPDGSVSSRQLGNAVKAISPHVDLFHVHNEPNWIFRMVRDNTDKKVVFDIHDWTSIRNDPMQQEDVKEEEYALQNADGFVVPSKGYLAKIRGISKKPSTLIYSKVSTMFYPKEVKKTKPGIVFEGGIRGKNKMTMQYDYRNWSDFAKGAANQFQNGHKVYFYTANQGENLEDYEHEKIEIKEPLIYPDLLQALSQHSVGLVGSPVDIVDFKDSMPNKLFEYVSAGIPCLVLNSPEAKQFVEENGLGMGIQDVSSVPEALEKLKDHSVLMDRWKYSMDGEIPQLIAFYEELCKKRNIAQPIL